jgi:hypothetical protein
MKLSQLEKDLAQFKTKKGIDDNGKHISGISGTVLFKEIQNKSDAQEKKGNLFNPIKVSSLKGKPKSMKNTGSKNAIATKSLKIVSKGNLEKIENGILPNKAILKKTIPAKSVLTEIDNNGKDTVTYAATIPEKSITKEKKLFPLDKVFTDTLQLTKYGFVELFRTINKQSFINDFIVSLQSVIPEHMHITLLNKAILDYKFEIVCNRVYEKLQAKDFTIDKAKQYITNEFKIYEGNILNACIQLQFKQSTIQNTV